MTNITSAAVAALKSSLGLGVPASVVILLVNSAAAATMQTPTEENVLAALVDFVDVDPAHRPFSIRIDTPFHDPYRGVLVEMLDCLGNLDTRSTEVNLSVEFTELKLSPSIVAHYDAGRTTATIALANDGAVGVAVGSVSLGGRHPAAFSKDADECSNRMLGSGGVCVVTVSYLADAMEGNPDHHAILRISNDSVLAPELSVALFGEQAR